MSKAILYIVTDLKDYRWLNYLIDEFKRINRFLGEINIVSFNPSQIPNGNIIYYTQDLQRDVCIVNKSNVQPKTETQFIDKDTFVIDQTRTNEKRFACPYDLFWNAFVFLSRVEEYQAEEKGSNIEGYCCKHPRRDKRTFSIPIVNNLFNEFEQIIRRNFPWLPFAEAEKPILELMHDVDYIEKTLQLRLKQTAFNKLKLFQSIFRPMLFAKQLYKTAHFLFSSPSYWRFEYWEELEKRLDKRSVFYLYSKKNVKGWRPWLFDPAYDVSTNVRLKEKLKQLLDDGFEIGLHGSFESAENEELLKQEMEQLEKVIGQPVIKTRQHWLQYKESITPYLHDKYFQYDSTLGWNDVLGFRSGCASQYHPYDHKAQKAFKYLETPPVIMDSTIFDYNWRRVEETTTQAVNMIQSLSKYKSAHVSICWHQRVSSPDYGWEKVYEKLLGVV